MSQELVSIISPCYNVGPYIGRFLDSLLNQTYKKLEIILVNDGATDNTGEIIRSYIPRLECEGYKVVYLEQENGGQSSAVNNALKLVTGQFLTWPDPDDWLTPDSIEKRVDFLKSHLDVGMVRCNIEKIDESTGKSLGLFEKNISIPIAIDNAFEKLVFVETWFGAMACMVRMDYFDKVRPHREIYVTKRGGQNWQMMLPMLKSYPFWQMPDVLGYYCVREDSHSHSPISFESRLNYCSMCEEILTNTLTGLGISRDFIAKVHNKYILERFNAAAECASIVQKWHYFSSAYKIVTSVSQKVKLVLRLLMPNLIYRALNKLRNFL